MKVYKYLDSSRVTFLSNGLIRFSQPGALNDPYECLPAFPDDLLQRGTEMLRSSLMAEFEIKAGDDKSTRLLKKQRRRFVNLKIDEMIKDNPAFLRDQYAKLVDSHINEGIGILSLSRRWNSALMWSHYTSSYSGFCVGFDKGHKFFEGIPDSKGEKLPLSAVRYSENRTQVQEGRDDETAINAVLTKSLDWSYEEEERLIAFLSSAQEIKKNSPYNIHLYKVPFDSISELVVGHRAADALKREIVNASERLGVPAYETKVSDVSFDVERTPL